jgi:hypothetical protein
MVRLIYLYKTRLTCKPETGLMEIIFMFLPELMIERKFEHINFSVVKKGTGIFNSLKKSVSCIATEK